MDNQFDYLNAEDEMHSLAKQDARELAAMEKREWSALTALANRNEEPDAHLDAAYEERTDFGDL